MANNATQERIKTIKPSNLRKPLKVSIAEAWQSFVSDFMLSFYSYLPKSKNKTRCQLDGHVLTRTVIPSMRCQECGTTVKPSDRVRAVVDPKSKQVSKLHLWHDDQN